VVNQGVLAARLERLREYLGVLSSIVGYDVNRFVQDPFIHGTAERNLHLAIECLLDIGNHVISDCGLPKPESYADIFRILGEQGLIPPGILKEIEGMAAFRNVLVHDYLRLDRVRVYQILREKLESMKKLGEIFGGMIS